MAYSVQASTWNGVAAISSSYVRLVTAPVRWAVLGVNIEGGKAHVFWGIKGRR